MSSPHTVLFVSSRRSSNTPTLRQTALVCSIWGSTGRFDASTMMNGDKAPSFDEMVREHAAVTLGEAKQYAAALPAEKRRAACRCYTCFAPACPGCCWGVSCLVNFCGACLMYNPFLCACPADSTPGAWTCTDMKGITYFSVVKVLPWQSPSSAPAPPQGAPGGSGQLSTPESRPSH